MFYYCIAGRRSALHTHRSIMSYRFICTPALMHQNRIKQPLPWGGKATSYNSRVKFTSANYKQMLSSSVTMRNTGRILPKISAAFQASLDDTKSFFALSDYHTCCAFPDDDDCTKARARNRVWPSFSFCTERIARNSIKTNGTRQAFLRENARDKCLIVIQRTHSEQQNRQTTLIIRIYIYYYRRNNERLKTRNLQ